MNSLTKAYLIFKYEMNPRMAGRYSFDRRDSNPGGEILKSLSNKVQCDLRRAEKKDASS